MIFWQAGCAAVRTNISARLDKMAFVAAPVLLFGFPAAVLICATCACMCAPAATPGDGGDECGDGSGGGGGGNDLPYHRMPNNSSSTAVYL